MRDYRKSILCGLLVIGSIVSGCTLKLTTDLTKIIGTDNPKELMGSDEAQKIATRIGEGMGTKIMEGKILAEDMGKGLGEVFLRPEQVPVITDPLSVDLIEKSGLAAIQAGRWNEAIDSFKRTGNLARLEEIALILFDRGNAIDAADLHQYLIARGWPLRAPYLVARRVERQGLAVICNAHLKEVDPAQYNLHYAGTSHTILDTVVLNEAYVAHNTLTTVEMINLLKTAPVIVLADAYFDTGQHSIFLEIIAALSHNYPVIGLEEQLVQLGGNRTAAEKLNYLPLLSFIEDKGIETFTHGTAAGCHEGGRPGAIDFFNWDSSLADWVTDLTHTGRQVIIIVGSTHARDDHLPFLIEERTGIDPVLVVQSPLGVTVQHLFEKHEVTRSRLAAWGAGEGYALSIDNDFYLNSPLSSDDFKAYIELFDLQPLLSSS